MLIRVIFDILRFRCKYTNYLLIRKGKGRIIYQVAQNFAVSLHFGADCKVGCGARTGALEAFFQIVIGGHKKGDHSEERSPIYQSRTAASQLTIDNMGIRQKKASPQACQFHDCSQNIVSQRIKNLKLNKSLDIAISPVI